MSNILKGVLEIAWSIIRSRREKKLEKELSKINKQKSNEEAKTIIETKIKTNEIKTNSELNGFKTDILKWKKETKETKWIKNFLNKELTKYKSPLRSEMIFSASKEFNIPIEYMMAIMKNDSHYWTKWKWARTFNPGNVWNTDDWSTKNRKNRNDWVRAVARNLARRTKEYKKIYWENKNPSIRELATNQWPDKNGFLASQANYKKPNQKRFWWYMTAEKWADNVEKISNQLTQNIKREISFIT